MDEVVKGLLVAIARRSLSDCVTTQQQYEPELGTLPGSVCRPGASFVTLYHDEQLRGCLGTVEACLPLALDVAHNTVAAATRDPRFPPVAPVELPFIRLTVTLLAPLQQLVYDDKADLVARLRPGIDGVLITWQERRALLLPQVWERLSDPCLFLRALAQKGGIPAHELSAKPPTITVYTFTAELCEEDERARTTIADRADPGGHSCL